MLRCCDFMRRSTFGDIGALLHQRIIQLTLCQQIVAGLPKGLG